MRFLNHQMKGFIILGIAEFEVNVSSPPQMKKEEKQET